MTKQKSKSKVNPVREQNATEQSEVNHPLDEVQKRTIRTDMKEGEKRHRIRVQFDIGYLGTKAVTPEGKSMTVPDMNLTVRQLLEDHTRVPEGVEVRKPLYFDLPIPTIKDITDVEEYRAVLKDQIDKVDQFIQEDKEKAAEELKTSETAKNPKKNSTASPSNELGVDDNGQTRIPDSE